MKRLTVRFTNGVAFAPILEAEGLQAIINKLADYEDTGLTPEQLREIDKAYTELSKELGRYKKLEAESYNIGDKLYLPFSDLFFVREVTITKLVIVEQGLIIHNDYAPFSANQVGKTVFRTMAEAEKALKERWAKE